MMRIASPRSTVFFGLLAASLAAPAAELVVNGGANLDEDFTLDSSASDSEAGSPLARTAISVGDAVDGVFEYFAAADHRAAAAGSGRLRQRQE